MLQVFYELLLLCCICLGCLLCCLLRVDWLCFLLSSQLSQYWIHWFLKFWVLSPVVCKNSWNSVPLVYKTKCYGDSSSLCGLPSVRVCFSSFSLPADLSLLWMAHGSLVPNSVSVLSTFFDAVSFLHLVVQFVLLVFGLFLKLFKLIRALSSCICGTTWA